MHRLSVLVVDDESLQRNTLASILSERNYEVGTAHDVSSATAALTNNHFDVVLADFRLPGGTGIDIARQASKLCPESMIFMMTAYAEVNSVIEAMRAGVLDYFIKPLNIEALMRRLEFAREWRQLQEEVKYLRTHVSKSSESCSILGQSPAITAVRNLIEQVSSTKSTVLIGGESGTGKEVVARELHSRSSQHPDKFVAVNCGALPENLLESELFGHKRGAFTGAIADKPGLFMLADQGTLFLDEIGELPKNLQVKLLRAVQEREITPVGGTKPVKVDLRIIAATNRDLSKEVENGNFRQDLFFRINVVEIVMPPLRERREDIPIFAEYFLGRLAAELRKPIRGLTNEACKRLMQYSWPGNIRELENIIERAVILSKSSDKIDECDLPDFLQSSGEDFEPKLKLDEAVLGFTRKHISQVLQLYSGDKRAAAVALGVSLSSLYRKLDEAITVPSRPESRQ